MPTVSSRPPTTLLMDLDSVLLPATCQLPQPPLRSRLPRLSSRLPSMRLLPAPRDPPQLPPFPLLMVALLTQDSMPTLDSSLTQPPTLLPHLLLPQPQLLPLSHPP